MTPPPRILGVAYGGGHANIVAPVLQALELRGVNTLFLALTTAGPVAAGAGLDYRSYRDYAHLVDSRRARKLGQELAVEMHNPGMGISLEESVFYLGINLLENIETLGEELAMESLRLAGRHSFMAVEFLRKIMQEEGCTHLVTTNSPRSEKASLIAAQQLGLKSFRIDDLYGVPTFHDSQVRRLGEKMYYQTTGRFKITPTQSCFLCQYARDNLIAQQDKWDLVGIDYDNSTITGQPVFDAIDRVIEDQPWYTIFPEGRDLPTVTWAHENGHIDEAEVISMLAQCFRSAEREFNLAIKIRPNIEPDEIRDVLALFENEQGSCRIIHTEMDANQLIWNSDVILGQVSTMLTQAAYMGRPVVILDPRNLRRDEPLARSGVARVVQSSAQLRQVIESLSRAGSQMFRDFEEGCRRMNFKHGGTANVCNLVESYL